MTEEREPARFLNFRAWSERRTIILCAVGAIAGLGIAGAGLFTAQGTRVAGVPPEDVAVINQVPILMSDYQLLVQSEAGVPYSRTSPVQRQTTLDKMIREELYVQRGIELGLQTDSIEVRTALVDAVEAQQAVDVLASQPTDQELATLYRQRADKYSEEGRITLTEYVTRTMSDAQAAVSALRSGQSEKVVVAAHKIERSGRMDDGEEFYFAARIHLGQKLFEIARQLTAGTVSDPVQLPDGVHILVIHGNVAPERRPFTEVRDRVLADYHSDKIARMRAGVDAFLRKRADVQIAQGF